VSAVAGTEIAVVDGAGGTKMRKSMMRRRMVSDGGNGSREVASGGREDGRGLGLGSDVILSRGGRGCRLVYDGRLVNGHLVNGHRVNGRLGNGHLVNYHLFDDRTPVDDLGRGREKVFSCPHRGSVRARRLRCLN
jgi:hypothetical protein